MRKRTAAVRDDRPLLNEQGVAQGESLLSRPAALCLTRLSNQPEAGSVLVRLGTPAKHGGEASR